MSLAWVDERMQRYEALLREKGIDLDQITTTAEAEPRHEPDQSTASEKAWQIPTHQSTGSGQQATTFEPQVLRGQKGTKFVDK